MSRDFESDHFKYLRANNPEAYRRIIETREREAEDTSAIAWYVHMSAEEELDPQGKLVFERTLEKKTREDEGDGFLDFRWR